MRITSIRSLSNFTKTRTGFTHSKMQWTSIWSCPGKAGASRAKRSHLQWRLFLVLSFGPLTSRSCWRVATSRTKRSTFAASWAKINSTGSWPNIRFPKFGSVTVIKLISMLISAVVFMSTKVCGVPPRPTWTGNTLMKTMKILKMMKIRMISRPPRKHRRKSICGTLTDPSIFQRMEVSN